MLKKIMVAMDESAASESAFDLALEMADALKAELTLIHALDVYSSAAPPNPHTWANNSSIESGKTAREDYRNRWDKFVSRHNILLRKHRDQAKAAGVTAHYGQPYGQPGAVIAKAAVAVNIDLIVVGSHTPSATESSVLGSVSNYLVHHPPCSLTVVHPDHHHVGMPLPSSHYKEISYAKGVAHK